MARQEIGSSSTRGFHRVHSNNPSFPVFPATNTSRTTRTAAAAAAAASAITSSRMAATNPLRFLSVGQNRHRFRSGKLAANQTTVESRSSTARSNTLTTRSVGGGRYGGRYRSRSGGGAGNAQALAAAEGDDEGSSSGRSGTPRSSGSAALQFQHGSRSSSGVSSRTFSRKAEDAVSRSAIRGAEEEGEDEEVEFETLGPFWQTIGGRWIAPRATDFYEAVVEINNNTTRTTRRTKGGGDNELMMTDALQRMAELLTEVPTGTLWSTRVSPSSSRRSSQVSFVPPSAASSANRRTHYLRQRSPIDTAVQALCDVCSFRWSEPALVEYLVGLVGEELEDEPLLRATVYVLLWLWIRRELLAASVWVLDEWTSVADEQADLFEAVMFTIHQCPFSLPPAVLWSLSQRMMPTTHVNDMMALLARPATQVFSVTPELGLWHLILYLATREEEKLPSNTKWRLPARSQNAYTATGLFFPSHTCTSHFKVLTSAADTGLSWGPALSPEEVAGMLLIAEFRDREMPIPAHLLAGLLSLRLPIHVLLELTHQNCKYDVSIDLDYRSPIAYHATPNIIRNSIILALMLGARTAARSGLLDTVASLFKAITKDREVYGQLPDITHFTETLVDVAAHSLKLLPSRVSSSVAGERSSTTGSGIGFTAGSREGFAALPTATRDISSTIPVSSENRLTSFPDSTLSAAMAGRGATAPPASAIAAAAGAAGLGRGPVSPTFLAVAPSTSAYEPQLMKWERPDSSVALTVRHTVPLRAQGPPTRSRIPVRPSLSRPSRQPATVPEQLPQARPVPGYLVPLKGPPAEPRGRGRPPVFKAPPSNAATHAARMESSEAEGITEDMLTDVPRTDTALPGTDPKLAPGHQVIGTLTSLRNTRWTLPVEAGQTVTAVCFNPQISEIAVGPGVREGKKGRAAAASGEDLTAEVTESERVPSPATPLSQQHGIVYVCDAPIFLDGRSTSLMYVLGTHIPVYRHVVGMVLLGGKFKVHSRREPVQGVAYDFTDGCAYYLEDENFHDEASYTEYEYTKGYELRPPAAAVCYLAANEHEVSIGVQKSVRDRWLANWPGTIGVIEEGTQVASMRFFLLVKTGDWNVLGIYANSLKMPSDSPAFKALRFHLCMMPSGVSHPRHTVTTVYTRENQHREALKEFIEGTQETHISQFPSSPSARATAYPIQEPRNTGAATAAAIASVQAGRLRRRKSAEEGSGEDGESGYIKKEFLGARPSKPAPGRHRLTTGGAVTASATYAMGGAASIRSRQAVAAAAGRIADLSAASIHPGGAVSVPSHSNIVYLVPPPGIKRGRGRPRKYPPPNMVPVVGPGGVPGFMSPESLRSFPSNMVAGSGLPVEAVAIPPRSRPVAEIIRSLRASHCLFSHAMPDVGPLASQFVYSGFGQGLSDLWENLLQPLQQGHAVAGLPPEDSMESLDGSEGATSRSRTGNRGARGARASTRLPAFTGGASTGISCSECRRFPAFRHLDAWQQDLSGPDRFAATVDRVIGALKGAIGGLGFATSRRLTGSFDTQLSSTGLSIGGRSLRSGMGINAGSRTLRLWQLTPIHMDFGPPRRGHRFR